MAFEKILTLFAYVILTHAKRICIICIINRSLGGGTMAIGERIRFFRNLRGMTQKYLGIQVGFPEKTADIRMAQYESGSRTPKADLTNTLAKVFEVSPQALTVPDIDSYNGLMHTLFTLEDLYGLKITELDGEVCLHLDKGMGTNYITMFEMFSAWQKQAEKYKNGEITKDEYDHWRYTYPKVEVQRNKDALDKMRKTN